MAKPKHLTNADLIRRVQALEHSFLDCRDPGLRHQWDLINNMHVVTTSVEKGARVRHLARDSQCGRCGAVKNERFLFTDKGIEKIGQTYTYPEGYLMPGVPRGVKPSVIIYQEQYRRAMEEVANAAPGERETAER